MTGASRNIGRGVALRLAHAGADVSIHARSSHAELALVAGEIRALGRRALASLGDVALTPDIEAFVARTERELGPPDILVHTVAIRPTKGFGELEPSDWISVRGIILDSAFNLARAVVPGMAERGYGRVVFFTGLGAYVGARRRAHVSAAKMGLVGLARGLASEYAGQNVRVNVLSPGTIDTERRSPEWYAGAPLTADGIPLGRLGTIEEVAAACYFLVSDECSFITGQTLHVNGGEAYFA